jgi:hypothetical protein
MTLPSVGQTWETDWSDGRVRRAKIEVVLADGRLVRLRFLDDGDIATVEAAALAYMPGSKWRPIADSS